MSEREIFTAALHKGDAADRAAYLEAACGADAALRQRVESLLAEHEQLGSFMEVPSSEATIDQPISGRPGTMIGPYKLLQQIGEGGFGVVFMAEQLEPVRRKVAVKVIKPGMDTRQVIARFEAERQALAVMDHPNIARVLDAGATESGRPYFVMELVRGIPITQYCDENQLPIRERLALFATICQAIQHAHTKGIIHRDIKPTNVLVTRQDGQPVVKVIDFGVAKAMGQALTDNTLFTEFAQMVGTPLYMSPEQAEMSSVDIDTRSDIYSLGVLLYELLTGSTPVRKEQLKQAAFDEVRRIIREQVPQKPSTRISSAAEAPSIAAHRHTEPTKLLRLVRGELDWIVMKALEKDRGRRYETASSLGRDVEHYLHDEPVLACPPSKWYRLRKLVWRNKGAFAFASTVAVGVLMAVVMLAVGYVRINRESAQREQALKDKDAALTAAKASEKDANTNAALAKAAQQEAHENLQDARAAVDQMLTRVADRLVAVPQMEHLRQELLEDALKFYQKFLEKKGDDPVIRLETAWAYRRLAVIQNALGQLVEAEQSYRKHFALFEELEAQSPLEPSTRAALARAHIQFAAIRLELGDREEHEKHLRRAVRIAEDLVQEFPKDPACGDALVYANLHLIAQIRHPPDQEEEMLRRNLTLTKNPHLVGMIYIQLGHLRVRQGRYPEAEKDYLKCLETYEPIASAQHELGSVLVCLADAAAADGQGEKAEALYRRATATLDKLATDYPGIHYHRTNQAGTHYKYANLLKKLDRTADAEQAYRRAVELYEKLAADFPAIPGYQQNAFDQRLELGRFLVEAGRAQDAQRVYGEAIALAEKLTADFPTQLKHWPGLIRSHIELGRLLERSGKTREADEAIRQALAISERVEAAYGGKPEYRRDLARSHMDAAWLLRLDSRYSEAAKLNCWALEHYVRLAGESPQAQQAREDLALAHITLAQNYSLAPGRLADAEKVYRQALEHYEQLSADFPTVAGYRITIASGRLGLAAVLQFQGRVQEAEQALKEALPFAERLAEEHPADATVRITLALGTRHRGETMRDKARTQEAEKAFRRAEAILEKLVADFPHETWDRVEWGVTCRMLVALLARDLAQPQSAEEFYRRDVAIFEKLAAEFPRDPSYRRQLADAHREWALCLRDIGRSQEATAISDLAIANFSQAIELGSNDVWGVWYPLALLHLDTGRTKEYRAHCERLLARFGQSDDPDFHVVVICKLAPDAVADLSRPVQLAENLLARDPDNADLAGVLGDTLYRQGDLDAAVERLEASIRAAPGVGIHSRRLFLAMAYHRLGRTAEAKQLLRDTTQWMEKNAQEKLAEGAELSQPLPWQLRLDLQLLCREAEELMGKKD